MSSNENKLSTASDFNAVNDDLTDDTWEAEEDNIGQSGNQGNMHRRRIEMLLEEKMLRKELAEFDNW